MQSACFCGSRTAINKVLPMSYGTWFEEERITGYVNLYRKSNYYCKLRTFRVVLYSFVIHVFQISAKICATWKSYSVICSKK